MRVSRLLVVLGLLVFLGAPTSAQALQLGFNDEDLLHSPGELGVGTGVDDAGLAVGLQRAKAAGATVWRIQLRWELAAPTAPPNDVAAADPSWAGYDWAQYDRQVRAVVAAGLKPLVWIGVAPRWAEGANRPALSGYYPVGVWKPNAAALKPFATAVAKRYSGSFPDPLHPGATLPRVSTFQGWNEPNIYVDLMPQYEKVNGSYVNTAATMYRGLLNAIYDGIKSVQPDSTIVAGATAPFGDYPDGGNRTPPVYFWRSVLCIHQNTRGRDVGDPSCPKIKFDVFSHHPYSPYPPTGKALNAGDATVPDVGKLTALVKLGVAAGTIIPKRPKPLWITEVSWDSAPDPDGLSQATQASYMQGAVSVLAHEGAQVILFWNSRDDAPLPSYAESSQSGIFLRGATPAADVPKLSWTAFHFPFTAYRDHGHADLWGKAPAAGTVTVQRRSGGVWKPYTKVRASADGVFSKRVKVGVSIEFRAVQGAATSLVATKR